MADHEPEARPSDPGAVGGDAHVDAGVAVVEAEPARNASQRDTRAGFEIYRATGGAIGVDDLNLRLADGGHKPVSLRTYNHYRSLLQAGYTRYVSINRFDVARASEPYESASGNGRYSYRATDLAVRAVFAKSSKVLDASGRSVEIGDVGALLRFDDPVAVTGLRAFKPQPGGALSVRFPVAERTVPARIVEADVQARSATVEVEFAHLISIAGVGAASALPVVETRFTLEGQPSATSPSLDELNRRLYHFLELIEGLRALVNRAGESPPRPAYAEPPVLDHLTAASPPVLSLRLAAQVTSLLPGDRADRVLAAALAIPRLQATWHDGTGEARHERLVELQVEQRRLELDLHQRESELMTSMLQRAGTLFDGSSLARAEATTLVREHVLPPLRSLGSLGTTRIAASAAIDP
jgi:hypothetical protein